MTLSFGEEAPIIPGETAYRAEVAIVVDTSASMGDERLKAVCSEAANIFTHMGGAAVSFIACDSKVHTAERVKTIEELTAGLRGGGGTDFRPVFRALEKMRPRPDVVIFATDGDGPAPTTAPENTKVIWLIVDGQPPCKWGEHICISSEEIEAA
jgi:predicted metal-dependent peptidase